MKIIPQRKREKGGKGSERRKAEQQQPEVTNTLQVGCNSQKEGQSISEKQLFQRSYFKTWFY